LKKKSIEKNEIIEKKDVKKHVKKEEKTDIINNNEKIQFPAKVTSVNKTVEKKITEKPIQKSKFITNQ